MARGSQVSELKLTVKVTNRDIFEGFALTVSLQCFS